MRPKQLTSHAFLQVQLNTVPASAAAETQKQITSASGKETPGLSAPQHARQHWDLQASLENSVLDGIFAGQEQSTAQCCVCKHKRLHFERTVTLEVCLPSKSDLWQSCSLKVCSSASFCLYCPHLLPTHVHVSLPRDTSQWKFVLAYSPPANTVAMFHCVLHLSTASCMSPTVCVQ